MTKQESNLKVLLESERPENIDLATEIIQGAVNRAREIIMVHPNYDPELAKDLTYWVEIDELDAGGEYCEDCIDHQIKKAELENPGKEVGCRSEYAAHYDVCGFRYCDRCSTPFDYGTLGSSDELSHYSEGFDHFDFDFPQSLWEVMKLLDHFYPGNFHPNERGKFDMYCDPDDAVMYFQLAQKVCEAANHLPIAFQG